ncbi:hypothetical protein GCM10022246_06210 [Pedobacter ginsengiterrae]|uniref:Uncharacterized protein n=1 Tax=Pedobacter ginsengiterrae TaxID=871696 RepID=A0ABP7NVG5_9SPHI
MATVFDVLRLTNVWDFRKGMAFEKPNPSKINPIEVEILFDSGLRQDQTDTHKKIETDSGADLT